METVDLSLGRTKRRDALTAFGGDDDAVVWEEVEARTDEEVRLSATFLAFMTVATMIASVGVVTDQPILIVGAMVVGPEFGPLAAIAVGIVRRRPRVAARSAATLLIGFSFAILLTIGFVSALELAGVFPGDALAQEHPLTEFIRQPQRAQLHRRVPRRHRGRALAHVGEVGGAHRGAHLGHHHPGCRRHRRFRRGGGVGAGGQLERAAPREPGLDRHGRR